MDKVDCHIGDIRNCLCTSVPLQKNLSTCVQSSCNHTEKLGPYSLSLKCLLNSAHDILDSTTALSEICAGVPFESGSEIFIMNTIILAAVTYPILALRCGFRYKLTGKIWMDDIIAIVAGVSPDNFQISQEKSTDMR